MIRDVETIDMDTDIQDAATILLENKFGCLPVLEAGQLTGILTEADFVRFVLQQAPEMTAKSA